MARATRGGSKAAVNTKEPEIEDSSEEEQEDAGEGYEVEKILKVKGLPGKFQYWVHWKDYGSDDDSWVTEEDASGSPELIVQFWAANPKLMDRYKVTEEGKPREKGKTARPSRAAKAETNGKVVTPRITRVPAPPKRLALSDSPPPAPAAKQTRKRKRDADDDSDEERTMEKHMNKSSWESIVERIDDVAGDPKRKRPNKENLLVYLKLRDGSTAVSDNFECNKRCPQKMLAFYEGKIKFRMKSTDDEDEDDD